MVVRAPTGMESDLSRPVIEIKEFPSGKITHEMFAFGSEIAVVPVNINEEEGGSPAMRMAAIQLKKEISRLTGIPVHHAKFLTDSSAEMYINDSSIGAMVGTRGESIRQLEEDLSIKLKVNSVKDLPRSLRKKIENDTNQDEELDQWRSRSGRHWENSSGKNKKGKGRKGRRN